MPDYNDPPPSYESVVGFPTYTADVIESAKDLINADIAYIIYHVHFGNSRVYFRAVDRQSCEQGNAAYREVQLYKAMETLSQRCNEVAGEIRHRYDNVQEGEMPRLVLGHDTITSPSCTDQTDTVYYGGTFLLYYPKDSNITYVREFEQGFAKKLSEFLPEERLAIVAMLEACRMRAQNYINNGETVKYLRNLKPGHKGFCDEDGNKVTEVEYVLRHAGLVTTGAGLIKDRLEDFLKQNFPEEINVVRKHSLAELYILKEPPSQEMPGPLTNAQSTTNNRPGCCVIL
ncbi:hypothetical protein RLOatenuis_1210 [Rickettsiales bacterium]|nr:hypothetical protein RLOatenuis_1210 [Rickettsiales bacterium]